MREIDLASMESVEWECDEEKISEKEGWLVVGKVLLGTKKCSYTT